MKALAAWRRRLRIGVRLVEVVAIAVGGFFFLAPPAHASCVALGVVSCSATVSASTLAFATYNPSSGTADDVSSTLSVNATMLGAGLLTTINYTISMDAGTTGSVAARLMTGGGGAGPALGYNIYTTSARDRVWGNATVSDSITVLATVLGSTGSRAYTMYGRIPAGQYVSSGSYGDTVTITVDY